VKDVVINELLKKWLQESGDDIVTFLKKLNVYNTQKVAGTVLNALFK